MSLCSPERRFWITVLDTPSSSASSRTDLLSWAMRASTSSDSISSLYSFATAALKPGFCIQRLIVDVGFLAFVSAIVSTCLHLLFVILLAFQRPVFLARRHLVALLDECIGDDHLAAGEEERQETVGLGL